MFNEENDLDFSWQVWFRFACCWHCNDHSGSTQRWVCTSINWKLPLLNSTVHCYYLVELSPACPFPWLLEFVSPENKVVWPTWLNLTLIAFYPASAGRFLDDFALNMSTHDSKSRCYREVACNAPRELWTSDHSVSSSYGMLFIQLCLANISSQLKSNH